MSGEIYKYDLDDLEAVATGLATLAADFESASRTRGDADGAMGYGDLRGAVREFVDNWEHERGKQLESISASAADLDGIIAGYVEFDGTSASGLREESGL